MFTLYSFSSGWELRIRNKNLIDGFLIEEKSQGKSFNVHQLFILVNGAKILIFEDRHVILLSDLMWAFQKAIAVEKNRNGIGLEIDEIINSIFIKTH